MKKILLCLLLVFSFNCVCLADFSGVDNNGDRRTYTSLEDNDGFFAKTGAIIGGGTGVVTGGAITAASGGSAWPAIPALGAAGLAVGIKAGRKLDKWFK